MRLAAEVGTRQRRVQQTGEVGVNVCAVWCAQVAPADVLSRLEASRQVHSSGAKLVRVRARMRARHAPRARHQRLGQSTERTEPSSSRGRSGRCDSRPQAQILFPRLPRAIPRSPPRDWARRRRLPTAMAAAPHRSREEDGASLRRSPLAPRWVRHRRSGRCRDAPATRAPRSVWWLRSPPRVDQLFRARARGTPTRYPV
jgi:hypothetical protein